MPARTRARVCTICLGWPCRCERDELGIEFPIRTERCPCGGPALIAGGRLATVTAAINAHNVTPEHVAWRARREGGDP